jgi:exodeoxyribonuclease V alpha subunit
VSDDGGFAVLDCDTDDEPIVVTGPLAHLERGERARVTGTWVRDPRYGPQVKATSAVPLAPADHDAVATYLVRVRHIGPRRAEQLVDLFGTNAFDVIDRDPHAAFGQAGLRGKRASEAAESWARLRATRHLHLLLAPHGLAWLTGRLSKHYGDEAARVVREEPYELTSVFGVGFDTADRLARGLGMPPDDPARRKAAALHALAQAERDGSTCLPRERLAADVQRLTGVHDADLVDVLEAAGDVTVLGEEWVYRPVTARLEAELADRVRELLDARPARKLSVPDAAAGELTDEQLAGVKAAFAHRLSIVTGGPGTGKTASIRRITTLAAEQKASLMLVAPTGRAAVRMTEATGTQATTVHSALGWIPGQGPSHDEDDPLDTDLLILDEASMANLDLLVTMLRAVAPKTNVVLVGDADQLAPVGAGKPFADLVGIEAVPTARLEHIFRQAAGSMIVQGAHAVRHGRAPAFRAGDDMRRDLFLIEEADPATARATIVDLVTERLPAHYGVDPIDDIQVFAPVYRGELGIDALNAALRARLNPDGNKALHGLRIGDKLMLTGRNLHELGLMNGTVMRLLEASDPDGDEDDDAMLTVSADGAVFHLSAEEAERLTLAYACSVHKGQGLELPIAVIVAHPAAGARFLRREMLYTALTRSTVATVVVGRADAVERAARTTDTLRRNSNLGARISGTAPRSRPRTSPRSAGASASSSA